MSLALRYSIVPLISTLVAAGALVNITVDDSGLNQLTGLGFSYSPTDDWNFGPTCTKCSVHLDPSQLLMGTWHDATASDGSQGLQSATLDFNGSAIYVFGVVITSPLIPLSFTSSTNLSFLIDDELVGAFDSAPVGNGSQPTAFQYHILLYSNSSIPHGPHTFVLQNGLDGGPDSIVLFDYLIYSIEMDNITSTSSTVSSPSTTPTSSSLSTTSTSSSSSALVTSTVHPSPSSATLTNILPPTIIPALLVLVVIALIVLWGRRRARGRGPHASAEVDLLGQSLSEANLNAHDNLTAGHTQYDDAPPLPEPYLLQPMQSAGPSSFSTSRERFSSGKSQSDALFQKHLSRNPSPGWRSELAETEYPEMLPPPYASEAGEAI